MNKVLEAQVDLANLVVEGGEKQLEVNNASSADPEKFVAKQTALMEEMAAKLGEIAQNNAKFAQDTQEELKSWFESGVATAEKAVKEAAEKAGKIG